MSERFVHVGMLDSPVEWTAEGHVHPFHQMLCVMKGRHRARTRDGLTESKAGQIMFFPAETEHEEWSVSHPITFGYIGFYWDSLPPGAPLHFADRRGRVAKLINWIYEDRHAKRDDEIRYRDSLLKAMCAELKFLMMTPSEGWTDRIRAYVSEHMAEKITLDDLAAIAGFSKYHFSRRYLEMAGVTPMADVRAMRLDAARHLLLTTSLPLKVIAPAVGLPNEYHLSRLLKAEYGAGARQLRRRS